LVSRAADQDPSNTSGQLAASSVQNARARVVGS
jgi:hypothetical protein